MAIPNAFFLTCLICITFQNTAGISVLDTPVSDGATIRNMSSLRSGVTRAGPATTPVTLIPGTNSLYTGVYYWFSCNGQYMGMPEIAAGSQWNQVNLYPWGTAGATSDNWGKWLLYPVENGQYLVFQKVYGADAFRPVYWDSVDHWFISNDAAISNKLRVGQVWRSYAAFTLEVISTSSFKLYLPNGGTNRLSLMGDNCAFGYELAFPVDTFVGTLRNFKYAIPANDILEGFRAGTKTVVVSQENDNSASDTEVTMHVSVTKTHTSTFTWSLTEGISLGVTVEIDAGIPLIASVKTFVSVGISFESTQEWSTTEEESVTIEQEVKTDKQTCSIADGYYTFMKDVPIPFTAELSITGSTNGRALAEDGGDLIIKTAPGFYVNYYMKQAYPATNLGPNPEIHDTFVYASIDGVTKASAGVRSLVSTVDCPPKTSA